MRIGALTRGAQGHAAQTAPGVPGLWRARVHQPQLRTPALCRLHQRITRRADRTIRGVAKDFGLARVPQRAAQAIIAQDQIIGVAHVAVGSGHQQIHLHIRVLRIKPGQARGQPAGGKGGAHRQSHPALILLLSQLLRYMIQPVQHGPQLRLQLRTTLGQPQSGAVFFKQRATQILAQMTQLFADGAMGPAQFGGRSGHGPKPGGGLECGQGGEGWQMSHMFLKRPKGGRRTQFFCDHYRTNLAVLEQRSLLCLPIF